MPSNGNPQTAIFPAAGCASAPCRPGVAAPTVCQLETSCLKLKFNLIRKNNRFYSTIDTSFAANEAPFASGTPEAGLTQNGTCNFTAAIPV
jgi:hypothetical protein